MKRTTLKKQSESRVTKILENRKEQEMMHRFFLDIWNDLRPGQKVCYETGETIYDPSTIHFHHVLPKHKYPEYKFSKWNIVLLSWRMHDQAEINDSKVPKVRALKDSLIRKHKNGELKP